MTGLDAEPLAASPAIRPADLDALAGSLSARDKMGSCSRTSRPAQAVRQLAAEIDTAATRIHSLVAAVKGFTYVNQQATLQPIAIGRGLADTVTVLAIEGEGEVGRGRRARRRRTCRRSTATAAS